MDLNNECRGGGRAATSSSDDIARGGGRAATSSSDDIARGGGKAATSSSDDIARGGGKAASQADADGVRGPRQAGEDLSDASAKSPTTGGDAPGEPAGRPPGGGDDLPGEPDSISLNRGGRTPSEVLSDPAALNQAERTMQQNVKDFDRLPPARQQELIREQAIYDEYKIQAEERTWNLADKVQRGEQLTVEDIMEMKSDPASMRTLKDLQEMDSLGNQLTPQEAQGIQREFNRAMDEGIHQPSYRTVEEHLHNRYPDVDPEGIRVTTVRTPGTEQTDFNINTDNDVIAEKLVQGPQGPEWVEIPKVEWEDTYYKALADNSGYSVDEAVRRFPDTDWANMDEAARVRQWAKHHEEAAMDQFDLSAGRDFSNQRTWHIQDGDMRGRPMIELTEDEIARGVDYVTIDGKPMRPSTGYELTQQGQGTMLDPEQLSLMEQKKFDDYWNAGDTPAQVMRNQTEAMEQLRKTACVAEGVEQGYRDMGYRVEAMPDNMKQAIAVVKDKSLSPAARVARLQELGYSSPGDFLNKVSSRIGAIRNVKR
jgi:Fe-S-cluster formation regulator IscX/YfhJ